MKNIDTFINTLLDGSRDEVEALRGSVPEGSSYEFTASTGSMRISFGKERVSMWGFDFIPAAVGVLGSAFSF